jgi:ABC-type transporter Mla subunit MlaD
MAESNALNGIRAGIFVVTTVVLTLTVVFVLLKVDLFASKARYGVDFTTADGVAGLSPGSDVQVGGVITGRVLELEPRIDEKAQSLLGIRVWIEMDQRVPLYWSADNPAHSARVIRVPSLLGNTAAMNFLSVGDPSVPRLEPGSTMPALESAGMLASLMGPENAQRARQIIDDAASTMDWVRTTLPKAWDSDVAPTLSNLNVTMASVRSDYESWRQPIGTTIQDAADVMGRADRVLAENEPRINQAMSDAATTLANARDMSVTLKDKSIPALQRLLDRGAEAADTLARSLDQVEQALTLDLPSLEIFLSDARQMAAQLKLAAIEVRHSPWKLLYSPKPGEVAHENLYDAARSFAMATEDLRAAGESLQAAVDRMPGRLEQDAAFRKQVQEDVIAAMDRYQRAQRRLTDVLDAPVSQGGEGK